MIPYKFNPLGVELVSAPPVVPPEGSAEGDLAILRGLRDNNPGSLYGTMFVEGKNPYTEWKGVSFNASNRVTKLSIIAGTAYAYTRVFPNINKLYYLEGLNLMQSPYPGVSTIKSTPLVDINLDGLVNLATVSVSGYNIKSLSLRNLPKVTTFQLDGMRADSVSTFFDFSQCPNISSLTINGSYSAGSTNTYGQSNIRNIDISKLYKLVNISIKYTSCLSLIFPLSCPDLKNIDIQHNQLNNISNLKLSQHLQLDSCNLQSNFFTTVPFVDFTKPQYQSTPYSPDLVNNLLGYSELARLNALGLLDAILLPQGRLIDRTIITN